MLVAKTIVLLFAFGLFYLSIKMLINPVKFAAGIKEFADWQYFHPFEICTRFIAALGFYFSHNTTDYQDVYLIMSGILIFTTFFLIVIGKQRHEDFAYRAAYLSPPFLRPASIFGILFSSFIVYSISLERLFT